MFKFYYLCLFYFNLFNYLKPQLFYLMINKFLFLKQKILIILKNYNKSIKLKYFNYSLINKNI